MIAYDYDHAGRLKEVTVNGAVIDTYLYDDNGNRATGTFWTNATGALVQGTYTYDGQDRLVSLTSAGALPDTYFDYTPQGALKLKSSSTFSYTFAYDAHGGLRLATTPAGRIDYVLDGFGRRIGRKKNGTKDREWIYADGIGPVGEVDSAGELTRFVYASGRNVPDMMRRQDGTLFRIITDQLGSVRLVVNAATGAVVQELDYNAFGVVTKNTAPDFQPFGFAGGMYDADTQLTRFGARDYDASIGRWVSKDPILFGGEQANLYAYVGNDPVNWVDSAGLLAGVPDWLEDFDNSGGLQATGDFFAGVASAASFGLSDYVIASTGLDKYGSVCSDAYATGELAAMGLAIGNGCTDRAG